MAGLHAVTIVTEDILSCAYTVIVITHTRTHTVVMIGAYVTRSPSTKHTFLRKQKTNIKGVSRYIYYILFFTKFLKVLNIFTYYIYQSTKSDLNNKLFRRTILTGHMVLYHVRRASLYSRNVSRWWSNQRERESACVRVFLCVCCSRTLKYNIIVIPFYLKGRDLHNFSLNKNFFSYFLCGGDSLR
jgi:hypothetical protein